MATTKTPKPKSYEHACEMLGIDPVKTLPWKNPKTPDQEADNARKRVETACLAANGDWVANYADPNQWKYYPWLRFDASAGRFRFDDTLNVNTSAHAGTGARLVLKTPELAEYIGKKFIDDFNKFMIK